MTSVMGQYLTGQVPVSGSEPSSLKEKFNIREGRAYSSFKLVLRIYSHKTEGIYPGTNMFEFIFLIIQASTSSCPG